MRRFKSRLSVTVVTLSLSSLVLSFQNCAPQNFEESIQTSNEMGAPNDFVSPDRNDILAVHDVISGSEGTPVSNGNPAPASSSPVSNVNSPAAKTVKDPGPLVMIGGCEGKIELKANSSSVGDLWFPYEPLYGGKICLHDGLRIFIYDAVTRKPSAASFQWCISDTNYGCSSDSEFKNGVGSASQLVNYWNTETSLKDFGTYFIFVKIQGLVKQAKYQQRALLDIPYGYGPGRDYFISSGPGANKFGFSCNKGGHPSSQGWKTYPFPGSLSHRQDQQGNPCYYRILTDS